MPTATLRIALAFTTALVMISSLEAHAKNLVVSSNFVNSIDGWTVGIGGAETMIAWNGADGSPAPGSLRLSSTLESATPTVVDATSQCIDTIPDEIVSASGMVLEPTPQFGVTCYVTLVLYTELNCSGSPVFTSGFPPNTPGVWESSGIDVAVTTAFLSVRPSLTMALNGAGAGEKTCLFDTISVESDSRGLAAADIPALSWPGMGTLIVLLALVALRFGYQAQAKS